MDKDKSIAHAKKTVKISCNNCEGHIDNDKCRDHCSIKLLKKILGGKANG